jgi:hypothetical protein
MGSFYSERTPLVINPFPHLITDWKKTELSEDVILAWNPDGEIGGITLMPGDMFVKKPKRERTSKRMIRDIPTIDYTTLSDVVESDDGNMTHYWRIDDSPPAMMIIGVGELHSRAYSLAQAGPISVIVTLCAGGLKMVKLDHDLLTIYNYESAH